MFKSAAFVILFTGAVSCFGQARKPAILDLLTPDEFRKAGLSKLTPEEIQSLNSSLMRIVIELGATGKSGVGAMSPNPVHDESELFDSRGTAIAYFDDDGDQTIYLWSGKPVAYMDEDSLFGFNGKHLGWLHVGAVYDHDGNLVAATPGRLREPVESTPVKGVKELKPFKAFKEFKPFKPFFGGTWSDIPARSFFLQGVK
jgi:hypothetical protein